MKYALVVATLMVSFCASSALADEGQMSKSMLSQMGIPGLRVMTDEEGLKVRGRFVRVWGRVSSGSMTRSYNFFSFSSTTISGSESLGGSFAFSTATAF